MYLGNRHSRVAFQSYSSELAQEPSIPVDFLRTRGRRRDEACLNEIEARPVDTRDARMIIAGLYQCSSDMSRSHRREGRGPTTSLDTP